MGFRPVGEGALLMVDRRVVLSQLLADGGKVRLNEEMRLVRAREDAAGGVQFSQTQVRPGKSDRVVGAKRAVGTQSFKILDLPHVERARRIRVQRPFRLDASGAQLEQAGWGLGRLGQAVETR